MEGSILKLHAEMPISRANGPGKRYCIWVQGCLKNCPGCFNPETHAMDGGYLVDVNELFYRIIHTSGIEGITISGGEPMLQASELLSLLKKIRLSTNLTTVLFSGWTWDEIETDADGRKLKEFIDILVSGPYIKELAIDLPMQSSSNQKVAFLSDHYLLKDLKNIWPAEVVISEDGTIFNSGIVYIK